MWEIKKSDNRSEFVFFFLFILCLMNLKSNASPPCKGIEINRWIKFRSYKTKVVWMKHWELFFF